MLHALADLGVLLLLFEVGLECNLDDLLRAGLQATLVALIGVAVPFAVGYGVMYSLGSPALLAVFVGATLTATSVGITARVLGDLGRLQDAAAKVVLGAAVVDDILGLIILAVVTGVAQTGNVSLAAVGLLSGKAIVFLIVAIMAGVRLAPALMRWVGWMQVRGTLIVYSVVFAVALAAVADLFGLAAIIGAFAAGLVLATTERRHHIGPVLTSGGAEERAAVRAVSPRRWHVGSRGGDAVGRARPRWPRCSGRSRRRDRPAERRRAR